MGFEINEGCERLLGRSRLHGGSVVDQGIFTLFEAHPDGNFSNSAFGSYLDAIPYNIRLMLHYWQHQHLYSWQLSRLFAAPRDVSARGFTPGQKKMSTHWKAFVGLVPN